MSLSLKGIMSTEKDDKGKPLLDTHTDSVHPSINDPSQSSSSSALDSIATQDRSFFDKYFGPRSLKGAIFNLIVAVVGAGILAFPFAIRASGLLWGLLLLLICTYFAYISLNLLIIASEYVPSHITPSYLTLSLRCGGEPLAIFTQINVILSLLGSAISRMVGAGGIIVILYIALFGGDKDEGHTFYIYFIVSFTALIIFPVSLMRSMSSLRFTSLLSVSCSLFLTICLFIEYFILCDDLVTEEGKHYKMYKTCFWKWNDFENVWKHDHGSHLARFTFSGFLTSVPIFIFGYNCQPNVFPIYMELENKSLSRMQKVFRRALSISVSLYIIAGSSAFLIFLNETCGNILLNDFHSSPEIVVASCIFTIAMVLATPVFVNAIRENINDMIWKKKQIALIPHVMVTFGICLLCVLVSVAVTDIATVFGFIGCTTNPITGYVLPTYFVWKLVPDKDVQHRRIKIISLVMVVVVVSVSLGSIYHKIYVIATDSNLECGNVQDID
eukprot:76433_1